MTTVQGLLYGKGTGTFSIDSTFPYLSWSSKERWALRGN